MTNGKAFGFGQKIPSEWSGTWQELLATDLWKELNEKYQFTDTQLYYIEKGFERGKLPPKEDPLDDQIFPFGDFKGKRFCELPEKYLIWLSKRDWLEKWPTVATYVKRYTDKLKEGQATLEEIKSILQPIK